MVVMALLVVVVIRAECDVVVMVESTVMVLEAESDGDMW